MPIFFEVLEIENKLFVFFFFTIIISFEVKSISLTGRVKMPINVPFSASLEI